MASDVTRCHQMACKISKFFGGRPHKSPYKRGDTPPSCTLPPAACTGQLGTISALFSTWGKHCRLLLFPPIMTRKVEWPCKRSLTFSWAWAMGTTKRGCSGWREQLGPQDRLHHWTLGHLDPCRGGSRGKFDHGFLLRGMKRCGGGEGSKVGGLPLHEETFTKICKKFEAFSCKETVLTYPP